MYTENTILRKNRKILYLVIAPKYRFSLITSEIKQLHVRYATKIMSGPSEIQIKLNFTQMLFYSLENIISSFTRTTPIEALLAFSTAMTGYNSDTVIR